MTYLSRVDVFGKVGLKASLVAAEEINKDKKDEEDSADQAVNAEDQDRAVGFDQHTPEDGPAEAAEAVVEALQEALGRRP